VLDSVGSEVFQLRRCQGCADGVKLGIADSELAAARGVNRLDAGDCRVKLFALRSFGAITQARGNRPDRSD